MLLKKLTVSLIVLLLIIINITSIFGLDVYLGGESVGVVLNYNGVLITGGYDIEIDGKKYNPLDYDFKVLDLITKVNGKKIENIESLTKVFEDNQDHYQITLLRNQVELNKTLLIQRHQNEFNSGLYVKDALSGLGTMTYYNPHTRQFACLGHEMNDHGIQLNNGTIYQASVHSIKKSQKDQIGQKNGKIGQSKIGTVLQNNDFGIFGQYEIPMSDSNKIETSSMEDVKLGNAYFLTSLNDNKVTKCEIEITYLQKQSVPQEKGIQFKLIDQNILHQTGGIIQGMSGFSIIQNGKLIGCVTHANSSNPVIGYGVYIDWMINNEEKK